jgi:hypothetical protein
MSKEWVITALTTVEVPVIGQTIKMDLEVSSSNGSQWDINFGCVLGDEDETWWSDWTRQKSFTGTQMEAMEAGLEFACALEKAVQRTIEDRLEFGKFRIQDYVGKTKLEIEGEDSRPWEEAIEVEIARGKVDYAGRQRTIYLRLKIEAGIVTGKILNLRELL